MRARGFRVALIGLAATSVLTSCAVGRFIAGAPSAAAVSARAARPGGALLVRRCAGCHELPDPGQMSAAAWRASLDRMKRRMRLPESEWDSLAVMGTVSRNP